MINFILRLVWLISLIIAVLFKESLPLLNKTYLIWVPTLIYGSYQLYQIFTIDKNVKIIKTEVDNGECYSCNGKGCRHCKKGSYKHYYHIIDNEKKIAFGMDTLK